MQYMSVVSLSPVCRRHGGHWWRGGLHCTTARRGLTREAPPKEPSGQRASARGRGRRPTSSDVVLSDVVVVRRRPSSSVVVRRRPSSSDVLRRPPR